MSSGWIVELFVEPSGASPIRRWLDQLSPTKFAALQAAITYRLEVEGIALVGSEWLKPLGAGLYEFRVRHTVEEVERMFAGRTSSERRERQEAVLLRVFLTFTGNRICLLFAGYDKGRDASQRRQQKEIARARRLKRQWELS